MISLFENGKFTCLDISTLERNIDFENRLNSKKFLTHWVFDDKLFAKSDNQLFVWDDSKWSKLNIEIPFDSKKKLYNDSEYSVFGDCFGEWGGTIYFYKKSNKKIFFTESTCANTIIKTDKGYQVLAHLGHGSGSSEIKLVPDPAKLTEYKSEKVGEIVNGNALGYLDKSNAFIKRLDLYGIQIFSEFLYDNEELFIVNLLELTFIAKIKNGEVEIVHPLFFNDLYTHNPITIQYGDYTLVNLDHYGTGLDREISVLIIHKGQIVKIDWNESH